MSGNSELKDAGHEPAEMEIEAALKHFRLSVHAWSEKEFTRIRAAVPVRRTGWQLFVSRMASPVAGWALAGAMAITAVVVPTTIHRQHVLEAERQAAALRHSREAAEEQVRVAAANAMSDEELMSHVDSDIAQSAPGAMEPLANLMNDTASE